jgi:hypothetical protein
LPNSSTLYPYLLNNSANLLIIFCPPLV